MSDPTTGAAPRPQPAGRPLHVALVLATSTGGIGRHVASLVEGLRRRGVRVTVAGPASTEALFGFASRLGADFVPVEIATGPRPRADLAAVRTVRQVLGGAHVVHAHGLRAGLLAGFALRRRRPARTPLIVTLHNAILAGGAKARLFALMERRTVRVADVVLGASGDLVDRARTLGARDARLGPVAAPPLPPPAPDARERLRAELAAGGRPVVLAVGRLAPQKDYPLLLDAARLWRDLVPQPLVVIAGDGPEGQVLQARIDAEDLPVRLLGRRDDVPDLLAAADVAVLTSVWEARALVAQEALRAGVPLVATAVGGVPELVGDAAVLIAAGDSAGFGNAVARLLGDPQARAELADRGRKQASTWPEEADTVEQVLGVYRELAAPPADRS